MALSEGSAAGHKWPAVETRDHDRVVAGGPFDVDDVDRVRQRLRRHRGPAFSIGPESTVTRLDTYFDTGDWRLRRAGCALRLRRTNGNVEATLELRSRPPHVAARTIEQQLSIVGVRAPDALIRDLARRRIGPVGTRVHAVVGRRRLLPLFEVATTRSMFPVRRHGAAAGAIMIEDSTSPRGRGRRPVRMTRLHLALADRQAATSVVMEPVLALLTSHPPLVRPAAPAFEVLLSAHELEPAESCARKSHIAGTMTVGEVALATIARQLGRVLAFEPAARLGENREALHDMRVATRRLRAAIRLFRPGLSRRALRVDDDLRIVATGLGSVRDLDVQLEELDAYRNGDGAADARALQSLVALYSRRRVMARQHMVRILESQHYRRAIATCLAVLRYGPLRRAAVARQPILAAAPRLIERPFRKFRKRGDRITSESPPEKYHALRIRCKRLRYAVEVHAGIYGKPARAWLQRLTELQSLLGAHQDAVVGAAHLRDLGQSVDATLPAATLAAIDRLADWNDVRARAARRAFPRAYRKTLGKRRLRLWRVVDARAD